jgi:hypothetical protein
MASIVQTGVVPESYNAQLVRVPAWVALEGASISEIVDFLLDRTLPEDLYFTARGSQYRFRSGVERQLFVMGLELAQRFNEE